jgi:glycerol-3-phosphate acyltransferase PlsX
MRIAVDVMGGDHGPGVVVAGAVAALRTLPGISQLFLVGREAEIRPALGAAGVVDPRAEVVHAGDVLTMEDKPVEGLRRKKDCSILRAVDLVREGRAQALVSPGNTGAVVAASTIKLRPVPGVERPGIATVLPTPENAFVLLDSGASVECRPLHLLHFAIMGSVYSQEVLGCKRPRVGLLNVGTEDVKGNERTQQAFKLCKQSDLNFIGNVEGHDLFANRVDVVVCDGFMGNVVLKTCESLASNLVLWLKAELMRTWIRRAGAFLAQQAFRTIKRRIDPDTYGGAPLLGLNGNVLIAHGSAREQAIHNAIRVAAEAAHHQLSERIAQRIAAVSLPSGAAPAAAKVVAA